MRSTPRSAAAEIVTLALRSSGPVERFFPPVDDALSNVDSRLARELVYGVLRWLRRLDWVIEGASDRPMARIERRLHGLLRVGVYQLLFLDRVPDYAAVDEAVGEARSVSHRGGVGFVNAVLRRVASAADLSQWPVEGVPDIQRLAIETSHPDFLVSRWVRRWGRETARKVLEANNRRKPQALLTFGDRGGRRAAQVALQEEGVNTRDSEVSELGLVVESGDALDSAAFRRGELYVQDEASQAAALIPPPQAGERILDAAAFPGGKSLALLAWEPEIELLAADSSVSRLGRFRRNCDRLGRRIPTLLMDARSPSLSRDFDRVLLDLPCSGTGTLRKHPELKWQVTQRKIDRLAQQGLEALLATGPLVHSGGIVVVSTCSIEPEENEMVVNRFLERQPEFALLQLELSTGGAGVGFWQLLPADTHDGFTVHVLRRL